MSQAIWREYKVYPGKRIANKVKHKRPERLRPHEVFYPPDSGHPRLKYKILEVMWLMSLGVKDSDISRIVQCSKSYPGEVRTRLSRLTPAKVLEKYQSIPWIELL